MSNNSRLAYLLGEMRREMNGAVVGSMRFYGAEYGLNYGVSLATIRAKAEAERGDDPDVDHKFAKLLYQQEVRELRLAAFWFAEPKLIEINDELDWWRAGIINTEVAEEAAFALLHRCDGVERWLEKEDGELLHYAAIMAIAKRGDNIFGELDGLLIQLIENEQNVLPKAIVILISTAMKNGLLDSEVKSFLDRLPESRGSRYIQDEMAWRLEFR